MTEHAKDRIPNPPQAVSAEEWEEARAEVLAKEKAQLRAADALAAERRRLPMVEVEKEYVLEGPEGKATLLELFEGRPQLIVYHFMYGPSSDHGCDGCSMVVTTSAIWRTCALGTPPSLSSPARRCRSWRLSSAAWGGRHPLVLVVRE